MNRQKPTLAVGETSQNNYLMKSEVVLDDCYQINDRV